MPLGCRQPATGSSQPIAVGIWILIGGAQWFRKAPLPGCIGGRAISVLTGKNSDLKIKSYHCSRPKVALMPL
jgi:hypothetical protein